ncbi:uncharacterized protein PAE49_002216 [Odontesthes bonariensis]
MLHTMGGCCNETQPNGFVFSNLPMGTQAIAMVLWIMLGLSLFCNILFCVSKFCSGKGMCRLRAKRSQSSRHMEDNPIYGNINYTQTSVGVYSEANPPPSSLSSLSLRNPPRVNPDSQTKNQDSYANLALKAPRVQSGRSSPQIQYSDVVHLEEPAEAERDDGNTDAVSILSDLYASVQTQRTKIMDTVDDGEGYANHL